MGVCPERTHVSEATVFSPTALRLFDTGAIGEGPGQTERV